MMGMSIVVIGGRIVNKELTMNGTLFTFSKKIDNDRF